MWEDNKHLIQLKAEQGRQVTYTLPGSAMLCLGLSSRLGQVQSLNRRDIVEETWKRKGTLAKLKKEWQKEQETEKQTGPNPVLY